MFLIQIQPMITISQVENVLMGLVILFLMLYGFASLAESKPHWFRSKTFLKVRKMEQNYDKMIESRREMLHHYYWGQSNNDKTQMKKIEKEIIKLDKEMEQIRSQYQLIRKGLPVPLKMF